MDIKHYKLGIFGANGRMGQALLACSEQFELLEPELLMVRDKQLIAQPCFLRNSREHQYYSAECPTETTIDVCIDFTLPGALTKHLEWCVAHKIAIVIGITGLSEQQQQEIKKASIKIPILYATNMSVGIAVMQMLLHQATQWLGERSDIEIIEAHHNQKKDAPSGTALTLGQTIATTLGKSLEDCMDLSRTTAAIREPGSIGFSTIRGGDIVGEHQVLYAMPGERIEISHKASSRDTFAYGALHAAEWLIKQAPGLYTIQEMLANQ